MVNNFFRSDMRFFAGALICVCCYTSASAQVIRYVHTDGLGSVSVLTDANRNIIERREYEPYGSTIGTATEGVGYTGHIADVTTGLIYMQQRYYDGATGRFMSVDPMQTSGNDGGNFNRYAYANNSPYSYVDPDGRAPSSEILYGGGGRSNGSVSAGSEINNLQNDGVRKFAKGTELGRLNAALRIVERVRDKVESVGSRSSDSAAIYFMKVFQPVSNRYGVELSANIVRQASSNDLAGLWYLRDLGVGRVFNKETGIGFMAPASPLAEAGYNVHTHPLEDFNRNQYSPFSYWDIQTYRWQRSTGYVSTPSMRLFKSVGGGEKVEEVE
ncbi:RHS repeat-associated core domain-containing protein [Xanthomonas sp. WHRI 6108]|uniref:RHS repeat-associated core domain-containing protein n=1 Tax=Xanthomonas TaxID=338 RepID=UPI00161D693C|nr:RHS repeat-associated core domain-containing protein [Xanthomonas arboricola]MBB5676593.1 RHS repeat-associated protein [Xanthomonas arboricola]